MVWRLLYLFVPCLFWHGSLFLLEVVLHGQLVVLVVLILWRWRRFKQALSIRHRLIWLLAAVIAESVLGVHVFGVWLELIVSESYLLLQFS